MTNQELKNALLAQYPVVYSDHLLGEMKYKWISAIIYRKDGDKIKVSAELKDKSGSVVICPTERIKKFKLGGNT